MRKRPLCLISGGTRIYQSIEPLVAHGVNSELCLLAKVEDALCAVAGEASICLYLVKYIMFLKSFFTQPTSCGPEEMNICSRLENELQTIMN